MVCLSNQTGAWRRRQISLSKWWIQRPVLQNRTNLKLSRRALDRPNAYDFRTTCKMAQRPSRKDKELYAEWCLWMLGKKSIKPRPESVPGLQKSLDLILTSEELICDLGGGRYDLQGAETCQPACGQREQPWKTHKEATLSVPHLAPCASIQCPWRHRGQDQLAGAGVRGKEQQELPCTLSVSTEPSLTSGPPPT